MSKETFYFLHDCKARHDRKLVNLIMQKGMIGIGVYWCIVEMLYEEGGYLPLEYERITFELRTDIDVVKKVIHDFELFEIDGDNFYSQSVLDRLQERCDKSAKAKASINKRWNKLGKHTNVIRPLSQRITNRVKKSIVKNTVSSFSLPDWIPEEIWQSYLDVRKKKKAADTPYALNLVINELLKIKEKHKQNPIDVLNKSITSGWADVYPLKPNEIASHNTW